VTFGYVAAKDWAIRGEVVVGGAVGGCVARGVETREGLTRSMRGRNKELEKLRGTALQLASLRNSANERATRGGRSPEKGSKAKANGTKLMVFLDPFLM
jgi:hypothetical protein